MSNEYKEPTLDRLADSHGWVGSKHMIECKKARSAP